MVLDVRRKSSTTHYQTFPTPPPRSRGQPVSDTSSNDDFSHARTWSRETSSIQAPPEQNSPLPVRQLCVLAVISLSEQTALNSIGPYLPQMASTFPGIKAAEVGLYVGTIASSFAIAQFATNFFWGWLSDRIGRKPVILLGTLLTAACFVAFGFVQNLWQAILVQVLMGLVNGNQGVVSTCLGEITDRSNQSQAFIYLPVIYGLGGITGPLVGGLLVDRRARFSPQDPYPYLRPNLFSAAVLVVDLIVCMIWLEESLEEAKVLLPLGQRVGNLFAYVWQFASSSRPSYLRIPDAASKQDDEDSDGASSIASLSNMLPQTSTSISKTNVLTRDTVVLLTTYLIFQLANVAFNALYPIFGQAQPPRGRRLTPGEIGFSLAFAGAMTIVFQLGVFGRLRDRLGNKVSYRGCIAGLALAFFLTPWLGYKDQIVWLYVELGFVLILKSLAAVGCLTSFLLLITNSAPDHSVLGTLNGIAQTLSAAGRAGGPFLAGGLFSLSASVEPKGEVLAFGLFGSISLLGFFLSLAIRGDNLEGTGDEEHGLNEQDEL